MCMLLTGKYFFNVHGYFIALSNADSFFLGISKLFVNLKKVPVLKIQFVVLVSLTQVYIVAFMIRNL